MKVKELFETTDEEQRQIDIVSRDASAIKYIKNPTNKALLIALKDHEFINQQDEYENFIKQYFAMNPPLMKKWLWIGTVKRGRY